MPTRLIQKPNNVFDCQIFQTEALSEAVCYDFKHFPHTQSVGFTIKVRVQYMYLAGAYKLEMFCWPKKTE